MLVISSSFCEFGIAVSLALNSKISTKFKPEGYNHWFIFFLSKKPAAASKHG